MTSDEEHLAQAAHGAHHFFPASTHSRSPAFLLSGRWTEAESSRVAMPKRLSPSCMMWYLRTLLIPTQEAAEELRQRRKW